MTPELRPRSFDEPREREVPTTIRGVNPSGELVERALERLTLFVSLKPRCDGCRDFLLDPLDAFSDLDVVILASEASEEWREARHLVLVAPEVVTSLGLAFAPVFLLVDPRRGAVLAEGTVFSASQVDEETAPHRR